MILVDKQGNILKQVANDLPNIEHLLKEKTLQ
jgi:hypothetical protein